MFRPFDRVLANTVRAAWQGHQPHTWLQLYQALPCSEWVKMQSIFFLIFFFKILVPPPVSVRFNPFLSAFKSFCFFVRFCLFQSVLFCPFLLISVHFCPFLSVSPLISVFLFLTVSDCFSVFCLFLFSIDFGMILLVATVHTCQKILCPL